MVITAGGPQMKPDVRNNARVMIDDPEEAAALRGRIEEHLPEGWARLRIEDGEFAGAWAVAGLNERLCFYRYDPGQRFRLHRDGYFARDADERSFLTVLLFLNEDFAGGHTRIIQPVEAADVRPIQGAALLFHHPLLHEGATLESGRKHILRSDVMYRRLGA